MDNAMFATLTLDNQISLMVSSSDDNQLTVDDILNTLTLNDCKNIIASSICKSTVQPITMETIVKRVIDEFDLHVLLPGIDAPQSEYDSESHRIAKNLTHTMSIDSIAQVIKNVFNESFETDLDLDIYKYPAEQIHRQLNHISHTINRKRRCLIINTKQSNKTRRS